MSGVLNVLLWLTSLPVAAEPVDGRAPILVRRLESALATTLAAARPECQSSSDLDADVGRFAELEALTAEEEDSFEPRGLDVNPLLRSGIGLRGRHVTRLRPSKTAPSFDTLPRTLPLRC
jgi:hypothetical protein